MVRPDPYQQVVQLLPPRLRSAAAGLPVFEQCRAEELRLRVRRPMTVVLPEGERPLGEAPVEAEDLERLLELASEASIHAVMNQVCQGYLSVAGGHRIGLCGTAAMDRDRIHGLHSLTSANLRIARPITGLANAVLDQLCPGGVLESTLILAPPGVGKTTLLRDLIRAVSDGEGCHPLRLGLVDERGEVSAPCRGGHRFDVGCRTDVLTGASKAQGLIFLMRSMNPQVLAVDEITQTEDADALRQADGCGVILLATAHGARKEDLKRRSVYRPLLGNGCFRRLVRIRMCNGQRDYRVEVLNT